MTQFQKGFAMLEIMLATLLLAAAIAILMKSSSDTSTLTNHKATSRAYAVIVNQILNQFYAEGKACQNASDGDDCHFYITPGAETASVYLNLSTEAKEALQAQGIDPEQIKVTTCDTTVGTPCT